MHLHIDFNSDILSLFTTELKDEILVKIPGSVLDFALALRGKEGGIVRGKYKLSNVGDLVRIKPKHANGKLKCLSQEIKNTTKYLQSLLTFSYMFFF